jgi:hypothetical protein
VLSRVSGHVMAGAAYRVACEKWPERLAMARWKARVVKRSDDTRRQVAAAPSPDRARAFCDGLLSHPSMDCSRPGAWSAFSCGRGTVFSGGTHPGECTFISVTDSGSAQASVAERLCSRLKTREGFLAGDPQECRKNAWKCADMAHTATTPDLKLTMIELSKAWLKLALELERAEALLRDFPPDTKKQA